MRPVSFFWLGWLFAKRLIGRAFLPRRGLARFLESYGPEGLFPLEPEEKDVVASLSRCTACGACDARFDAYDRIARTTLRSPSELVLAASRSLPDWDALAAPIAELEKGDLAALEAVCPARVPFARVARVAKERALRQGTRAPRELPRGSSHHDPG